MILTGLAWMLSACAPTDQGPALSASEKLQFETLQSQLTDASRLPQTRQDAARLLLSKDYPQAAEALLDALKNTGQPGGQVAVADAIADAGNADVRFVEPLVAMLTGENSVVRPAAARALVTYQNHGVSERLIRIAQDQAQDRAVRQVTIASLRRIVTQPAVRALIDLLQDPAPEIRAAAAESLTRLTNIRSYGTDVQLWEAWWARNRNKTRAEWLAELAESLTRAQMTLESENLHLRERLVNAMTSLYNASPKSQRPAMLAEMYASYVSDVRLLAARLTDKMIATNEPIGPEIRQRIRTALDDPDPRVRELAALLEASLPEKRTPELLLAQLDDETSPQVRAGILKALGQLKTPLAVPAILKELPSPDVTEATAAAEALTRIVAEQPLAEDLRKQAAAALKARYAQASAGQVPQLREALLRAMGMVADASLIPPLVEALDDPAGTIRLAAVTGLTRLGAKEAIDAIEPLLADPDRGVRQAALAAMARLGQQNYLQVLLKRTDPAVEADATVRRQAWAEVLDLCQRADAETLGSVLAALAQREGVDAERITILGLRVEALRASESADLPAALLELANALRAANRANEAVTHAAEAVGRLERPDRDGEPVDAAWEAAWRLYVATLLEADDPAFAKVVASQVARKGATAMVTDAIDMLFGRLVSLQNNAEHLAVISLADAALTELTETLTSKQRERLRAMLETALAAQAELDRDTVKAVLPGLVSTEAATRTQAETQLKTMGDRAVRPLVEQLGKLLGEPEPDARLEAAILGVLKQMAPKLTMYDEASSLAQKRQIVADWLDQL